MKNEKKAMSYKKEGMSGDKMKEIIYAELSKEWLSKPQNFGLEATIIRILDKYDSAMKQPPEDVSKAINWGKLKDEYILRWMGNPLRPNMTEVFNWFKIKLSK